MSAHSNVVVNLKAREAVALAELLATVSPPSLDAAAAVSKVNAAAERAAIAWAER